MPKKIRAEVRLNPAFQKRLLDQMKEDQAAAMRGRAIRMYVVLPLVLAATVASVVMMIYGDTTESVLGNLLASCLLWYFWVIRKRIGSIFGF
jgi:hypothetical protein